MRRFTTTIGFAALVALSGCHSPGGGIMPYTGGSNTYFSTETRPVNITLIDLRTGEEVFAMEVPVGKQLTFDFVKDDGDDPVMTPDLMRYQVWDIGTKTGTMRNSISVPNSASRRIDVSYRIGPEYQEQPAARRLRTDELQDRPDWWSPRGGEMPAASAHSMYDG